MCFFGKLFLIHDFYGQQKIIKSLRLSTEFSLVFPFRVYIFFTLFLIHSRSIDVSSLDHWCSLQLPSILLLTFPCDELNCGTKHLSCLLESVYKHRITLVYFHDDIFSFSPGFVCCMRFCCLLHETVRNIGFAYNEKRAEGKKTVYLKYHACASTLRWWLSDAKIERTRENLFSLLSSSRRQTYGMRDTTQNLSGRREKKQWWARIMSHNRKTTKTR